ncbi:MaoC/PaaZ C-terminal domain-containing protein [Aliidiomarina sanyensis]|uniref:Acyl dehydratase n=1 Tax=Aliidiomarina sanyensis TaxID=1249555 RepID=A0A432WRZ8_9GAMM|nr:MaoC/PaaZ C-terminal domain-containing protein [Aliidiomarina sanyensis]RUO36499.1 acyl dehydratase [Aliidiomarina sanyensis]
MSTQHAAVQPQAQAQSEALGKHALPGLPLMLLKAVPTMIRRKGPSQEPEDIHFRFQAEAIDAEHLARYHAAFQGFHSEIPLTYLYLLAQRAHLAAMLDEQFPWPILGMVHVANEMAMVSPVLKDTPFDVHVHIEMPERAATRKRVRPVYTVDFHQKNELRVRCVSTYQVGAGEAPPRGRKREMPAPDLTGYQHTALWQMSSELGRSYALLSGDYNPIHLHPWLSRWFGFERPIIHGMYSVAYAQAELERQLKRSISGMAITFRRPLILPAEAAFHYHQTDSAKGQLIVTDALGKRAYLDGDFHCQVEPQTQQEDDE